MRDAFILKGTPIFYNKKNWIIGETYYIPGNQNLYIELKNGGVSMNVRLVDILSLLVGEIV